MLKPVGVVHTNPLTALPTASSSRRSLWQRFRRHRMAVVSLAFLVPFYAALFIIEFFAPHPLEYSKSDAVYSPPQSIYLVRLDADQRPIVGLFTYGITSTVDMKAMRRTYIQDESTVIPLGFFVQGSSYRLLGLIETDIHFFGPQDPEQPFFWWGADRLGRDVFSRVLYGARISLSIGLVGVTISFVVGILLGSLSGYCGGWIDTLIQRTMEFIRSLPTIPIWLGLAAALPMTWSPLQVYFVISLILSLVGWTTLARVVRSRFLAIRNEDYILAARSIGCTPRQIIFKHMLPSMTSHIIAAITLALPNMILAETALSFLGLGLRPPIVSWGVLLQESQSLRVISSAPWMLFPAFAVVLTILAFNFVGDGLRDAADPYV